jgi:hypothetical protein
MARQYSAAVRNAQADAWESAIGTSAIIRIRTGAQPASCGDVDTGTALASFSLASDWTPAASGGAKTLASLPISTTGSADGTAAHYRIYASNGTTCHEQGSVGTSGQDMIIDNASISNGQTVRITAYTKTWPGA